MEAPGFGSDTEDMAEKYFFYSALQSVLVVGWEGLFQWSWWCLTVNSVMLYCVSGENDS
jgi:hypothetical protein